MKRLSVLRSVAIVAIFLAQISASYAHAQKSDVSGAQLFEINKTELKPSSELKQFVEFLNTICANGKIDHVTITGAASPDGNLDQNTRLANGRAMSVRSYLCTNTCLEPQDVSIVAIPEDWDGLDSLLDSYLTPLQATEVREIIASTTDLDLREQRMSKLSSWPIIYEKIMPRLRRVAVEALYGEGSTVVFTVDNDNPTGIMAMESTRPETGTTHNNLNGDSGNGASTGYSGNSGLFGNTYYSGSNGSTGNIGNTTSNSTITAPEFDDKGYMEYVFSPSSVLSMEMGGCGKTLGWFLRFGFIGINDPSGQDSPISWSIQTGPVFRLVHGEKPLFLSIGVGYQSSYLDKHDENDYIRGFAASAKISAVVHRSLTIGLGYTQICRSYHGTAGNPFWRNLFVSIGGWF